MQYLARREEIDPKFVKGINPEVVVTATRAMAGVWEINDPALTDGHFPALPVVPGIRTLRHLIEVGLGDDRMPTVSKATGQWRKMVSPGDVIESFVIVGPNGHDYTAAAMLKGRLACTATFSTRMTSGVPSTWRGSERGQLVYETDAGIPAAASVLPHKPPILYVDGISNVDGCSVSGFWTPDKALFEGGQLPLVDQLEHAAQIAAYLLLKDNPGATPLFTSAEAAWYAPVQTGDTLATRATLGNFENNRGQSLAMVRVGDTIAVNASMGFFLQTAA